MDTSRSDGLLAEAAREFRSHKGFADRAMAQVDDDAFFAALGDGETNSIAVTAKHVGGNLRSRWRDFLTTDGEKPDRQRDREFEILPDDTRASILALWEAGWETLFGTLAALSPDDLERTVVVRGEPVPVPRAALRSLAHISYHVGQIVQLARHWKGADWQTLSVPRGQSEEHTRAVRAQWEKR